MKKMKALHRRLSSCRAFTLVELLGVVTVIVILAALLIPAVGKVVNHAKKTHAISNLRQIAIAYNDYLISSGAHAGSSKAIKNVAEWAAFLEHETGLNDPSLFFLKDDPLVEASTQKKPLTIPELANYPCSFNVVFGISSQSPASTTPLAWTRGLNKSGSWEDADAKKDNSGVYSEKGGHIVFLDGHVAYYKNLTDEGNQLVKYGTQEKTNNIYEAINPSAKVLTWKGEVSE